MGPEPQADLASVVGFNEFLHALRSRELARLPAAARTIVSGGCAGEWYFDWFRGQFPGHIERHYGIELFSDPPAQLPSEVTWLRQSLASMTGVQDGEADLVFGGEVIEHLWPDDIAGFLAESWRVLRPGGVIALDSPNRVVAEACRWTHPEHTLELSVAEIAALLEHAGFEDVVLRGVWLCYDRETHRPLEFDDLDGQALTRMQRASLAESRPEDSFVWWAQATRGSRPPEPGRMRADLATLYAAYRPGRLARVKSTAPERWDRVLGRVAANVPGEASYLLHGPYVPVAPGEWEACFRLGRRDNARLAPSVELGELDVMAVGGRLAVRSLLVGDLPPDGSLAEIRLPFTCTTTRMGIEFRVLANGAAALEAPMEVGLRRRERSPAPTAPPAPGAEAPAAPSPEPARRLSWPIRRILDPRLRLLHQSIERVEQRLIDRLDALAPPHGDDRANGSPPAPPRAPAGRSTLGYNKLCELEDFRDPELAELIRDMFPRRLASYGATFPAGREYRKYWEVAMAARSFRDFGALHRNAEILGVGAGVENTLHWLTRHVRAVHATDTYLRDDQWSTFAGAELMLDPERTFSGEWNPRRLVVQHMDRCALRYEDEAFDGVFSSSSIEHFGEVQDVRRSLAEICRVLRPGAIAAISTEFRLSGPPPGLPDVLMFDAGELRSLIDGLPWEPVSPLSLEVSPATLESAVAFELAAADVRAGREWSQWPHLVLSADELLWTSVHLTLRKLG